MHIQRKFWFNYLIFLRSNLISLLNFGQNYFVQLRWNWFSVWLPVTSAWNCHSLYTAFSSNVGAWGMWAYSLFLVSSLTQFRKSGRVWLNCDFTIKCQSKYFAVLILTFIFTDNPNIFSVSLCIYCQWLKLMIWWKAKN